MGPAYLPTLVLATVQSDTPVAPAQWSHFVLHMPEFPFLICPYTVVLKEHANCSIVIQLQ